MLARFRIGTRLIAGFGVMSLLVMVFAAFSILSAQKTDHLFLDAKRRTDNAMLDMRMEKSVTQARMMVWAALASDDASRWTKEEAIIAQAQTLQQELLRNMDDPDRRAQAEKLGQLIRDYQATIAPLKNLHIQSQALQSSETQATLKQAAQIAEQIDAVADSLNRGFIAASQQAVDTAEDQIDVGINGAIILSIVCLSLGILVGGLISRSITRPLSHLMRAIDQLGLGRTDIQIPELDRADELGPFAQSLEDRRRSMIEEAQRHAAEQAEMTARQMRAEKIQSATSRFDDAITTLLTRINNTVSELHQSANQLSANAEQTQQQSAAVSAASEQATANVQTVSAASTQLMATVQEILRIVHGSVDITQEAAREANSANHRVHGLANAASKIGEVVNLINSIASQTSLLALNATIESARAGEAGKGFAVVAHEVKNLAGQTGRATEEIGSQITAVQDETRLAVEMIGAISDTVTRINTMSTTIAGAVEEQGAATAEISRSVEQASLGTQEISSNIADVARAAAQTGAMARIVNQSADMLIEESHTLEQEVQRFLEEVRAA